MKTKSGIQFEIVVYEDRFFEDVKTLWREAPLDQRDWRAPEFVIPAKTAIQPELFLVAMNGDRVIGTTMAGYDGHRGWLYTVAVLQSWRREGVGSALLREAEGRMLALGCPKINVQIVSTNAAVRAFYKRLGYAAEERVSMSKLIGVFAKESSS